MREIGANRRWDGYGECCSDAQLHSDAVRHFEDAKDFVENWNDDCRTANTKQPGEQAGDDPRDENSNSNQDEFADGNSEQHAEPRTERLGGGLGEFRAAVHHERERMAQYCHARIGLDRFRRKMPTEQPRARNAAKQAQQMARDVVQTNASR